MSKNLYLINVQTNILPICIRVILLSKDDIEQMEQYGDYLAFLEDVLDDRYDIEGYRIISDEIGFDINTSEIIIQTGLKQEPRQRILF